MRRHRARGSSFSPAGSDCVRCRILSGDSVDDAFGGEGEHEAGDSAEEHADADESADDPDGAVGPGTPDHDGEDEGDDGVEEKPACAVTGPDLEELDDLEDAFKEEIAGKEECEGEQAREWVHDEVKAGDEIDDAEQYLPDDMAGGVGFEGEDEVGDAADDHEPAEDEGDGEAGDPGDEDGDESGEDEKYAEGDGPVDGFGGDVAEG
jgi:hypothetical protein